jgi:lipopolysaccharide export system protein LptA
VELDERQKGIRAEANARAVFETKPESSKVPALLGDSKQPTYARAARMVFDDASRTAVLSGGATLWQGESSLSGQDVTLNDVERTLVAVGQTRTLLASRREVTKQRSGSKEKERDGTTDREPTLVTARRVIYRESEGRAVFDEAVAIVQGPRRATADRATALLGANRQVERVELLGSVSLTDSLAGRTGAADRAIDLPREERTILEGSPAWVKDAQGNRVEGATLTIRDRGHTVEVTAPPGGKTQTIHRTQP